MVQAIDFWEFELYIAGETPKTKLAYSNLRKICDDFLPTSCRITVYDLLKNPELAKEHQIMAIPTIIRRSPLPKKTLIGDLRDSDRVISKLELK